MNIPELPADESGNAVDNPPRVTPERRAGQVVRKKNKYDLAMGDGQFNSHQLPGISTAETTFSIDGGNVPPAHHGSAAVAPPPVNQPKPIAPAQPSQMPGVFVPPNQAAPATWAAPPIADSFASVRGGSGVKKKPSATAQSSGYPGQSGNAAQALQPTAAVTAGPVSQAEPVSPNSAHQSASPGGHNQSSVSTEPYFGNATSFAVVDDPEPTAWEKLRESTARMVIAGVTALALVVGLIIGFNILFGPKLEDHASYKEAVALLEQGAAAQENFFDQHQRYATWEKELADYGVPEAVVYDMSVISATNSSFCLRAKAYVDSKEHLVYMGNSGQASSQTCR